MNKYSIPKNRDWEKWLPWGAKRKVAKHFGVNPSTVNAVFKGRYNRPDIIKALIEEALANKQRLQKIEEEQNELLKQLEQ